MKLGIDFGSVKDNTSYDLLPQGEYLVKIDSTEMKENKNRTGNYLRVNLIVAAGPFSNRKLTAFFNVNHENTQAEGIGRSELKALILNVGLNPADFDTNNLHGKHVLANVVVDGEFNRVKYFKKMKSDALDGAKASWANQESMKTPDVPF